MLPALKDIGVTKNESSRLQKIASNTRCDLIKQGQERGEIAKPEQPRKINIPDGNIKPRTLSEFGLTAKQSHGRMPKQKEFVGHGNFVKWIENNLDIDDNTVYRYIKLYSYADKIPILGNLQDAYKQIETIEAQAKLTAEEKQRKMIAFFLFPYLLLFQVKARVKERIKVA